MTTDPYHPDNLQALVARTRFTRRALGINRPCPIGTCHLPRTCQHTGRICTDPKPCAGCCPSCGGSGIGGSPETNGRCADCRATGHTGPCDATDLP